MAGFDVLEIEPPENMGGLMNYENFVCTPHIGGSTSDSVLKMGRSAIECLDSHFIL
jgi:D-3-phosphoglycerate dehydrogenase